MLGGEGGVARLIARGVGEVRVGVQFQVVVFRAGDGRPFEGRGKREDGVLLGGNQRGGEVPVQCEGGRFHRRAMVAARVYRDHPPVVVGVAQFVGGRVGGLQRLRAVVHAGEVGAIVDLEDVVCRPLNRRPGEALVEVGEDRARRGRDGLGPKLPTRAPVLLEGTHLAERPPQPCPLGPHAPVIHTIGERVLGRIGGGECGGLFGDLGEARRRADLNVVGGGTGHGRPGERGRPVRRIAEAGGEHTILGADEHGRGHVRDRGPRTGHKRQRCQ